MNGEAAAIVAGAGLLIAGVVFGSLVLLIVGAVLLALGLLA